MSQGTGSGADHLHGHGVRLTLFSIGSAFWGIVAGVLTLLILNWRKA
jgi:hypothetical protein